MNFEKAIKNINRALTRKQPASFNQAWIKKHLRTTFFYIEENIKNELDATDWDLAVSLLEREFQKKWMKGVRIGKLSVRPYKNYFELEKIIKRYENKLYTFVSQEDKDDRRICDLISIRLVRTTQKGNLLAKQKVIALTEYLVNQWIENDKRLSFWQGYNDLVLKNIEDCVRRFRYAGSFLGYLFRTLEYSGRGLRPLKKYSLDDYYSCTINRKVDMVVKDDETGSIRTFHRNNTISHSKVREIKIKRNGNKTLQKHA